MGDKFRKYVYFSTSEKRAQRKIRFAQSRHGNCKFGREHTVCLCFYEHNQQLHKLIINFPAFKSKLDNPWPIFSGTDYESRTARQSMFKGIEDAYRRRKIWLGSNGGRRYLAGSFKNKEGHLAKMKIDMDVASGWR